VPASSKIAAYISGFDLKDRTQFKGHFLMGLVDLHETLEKKLGCIVDCLDVFVADGDDRSCTMVRTKSFHRQSASG